MKTNYGFKEEGKSRFIIVAPHAAGDDLRTRELAQTIAEQLGAYLVVNNQYKKSKTNFNSLPWFNGVYVWKNKNPHMKEFYDDINEFAKPALQYSNDGKVIIVYIHGMSNGDDKIGIDIGFGAKCYKGKLRGTHKKNRHPEAGSNTGKMRARVFDIIELKKILEKRLLTDYCLKVGIGEAIRYNKNKKKKSFVAWSMTNGIQYPTKTLSDSFQLEISRKLRKLQTINYTAKIIAEALKQIYSHLDSLSFVFSDIFNEPIGAK